MVFTIGYSGLKRDCGFSGKPEKAKLIDTGFNRWLSKDLDRLFTGRLDTGYLDFSVILDDAFYQSTSATKIIARKCLCNSVFTQF